MLLLNTTKKHSSLFTYTIMSGKFWRGRTFLWRKRISDISIAAAVYRDLYLSIKIKEIYNTAACAGHRSGFSQTHCCCPPFSLISPRGPEKKRDSYKTGKIF